MSVQLLGPAEPFALFGKLPSAGDFVRLNLAPATVGALDAWLEAGLASLQPDEADTPDRVAEPPAWRLWLDAGVAGPQAFAGVMAPSGDASGRRFPCLALAAAEVGEGERSDRVTPASVWCDAVLAVLTSAVSHGRPSAAVMAELNALGPPRPAAAADFLVKVRAGAGGAFVDVRHDLDVRDEALAAAWDAAPPRRASSRWWRHEAARTLVVTSEGLPRGDAFRALFHVADRPVVAAPGAAG